MEEHAKKLDFLTKHWAPFPRHLTARFPVVTSDRMRAKDHWVRHSFQTCNFSLILRGQGTFTREGKTWPVVAPCVITQWPNEPVAYGPPPSATWDEFYIIYSENLYGELGKAGLIEPSRPIWPMANFSEVITLVDEFTQLARHPHQELAVDRVDYLAEMIIAKTLLPSLAESVSADDRLARAASALQQNIASRPDFDALARKLGMSPTTLRRRWIAAYGDPPARYMQVIRMRMASRLLVESIQSVQSIASSVGFDDEFYFSRAFRREFGMPPREYRKMYQLGHSEHGGKLSLR